MVDTSEKPKPRKSALAAQTRPAKKQKAASTKEKVQWDDLTAEMCLKSMSSAVHLASKSVNTNATAVGVRVALADRLMLHFVAVSTLNSAQIPVDYISGAQSSGTFKQIATVLDNSCDDVFTDINGEQRKMIEEMRPLLETRFETGVEFISPRLRQVIWPTGNTSAPWVALTPLQSSGLSAVIRKRLAAEAAQHVDMATGKTTVHRPHAIFGIGGGKSVNVGRYVNDMRRPLVFGLPQIDPSVRMAYAFYFKGHLRGHTFAAPYQETLAFAKWRHTMRAANGQKIPSTLAIRAKEVEHVQAIARAALSAASFARHVLEKNLECTDCLTAPNLDPFLRALIDPKLRDRNFRKTFARKLISSIEHFRFKDGGIGGEQNEYAIANSGDLSSLISEVEEVIA